MSAIVFSRMFAMPSGDTFSIPTIMEFVRRWSIGKVESVDPFARNSRVAIYRNDLNPKTNAEHHMPADEFLLHLNRVGVVSDLIILDPPYSPRQISELYKEIGITCGMKDTQTASFMRRVCDAAHKLTRPGTIVLSFGWNSVGMGLGNLYAIKEILLVNHGGHHNDTICMAQERIEDKQESLKLPNPTP